MNFELNKSIINFNNNNKTFEYMNLALNNLTINDLRNDLSYKRNINNFLMKVPNFSNRKEIEVNYFKIQINIFQSLI